MIPSFTYELKNYTVLKSNEFLLKRLLLKLSDFLSPLNGYFFGGFKTRDFLELVFFLIRK